MKNEYHVLMYTPVCLLLSHCCKGENAEWHQRFNMTFGDAKLAEETKHQKFLDLNKDRISKNVVIWECEYDFQTSETSDNRDMKMFIDFELLERPLERLVLATFDNFITSELSVS